jgi:hypothetical protein
MDAERLRARLQSENLVLDPTDTAALLEGDVCQLQGFMSISTRERKLRTSLRTPPPPQPGMTATRLFDRFRDLIHQFRGVFNLHTPRKVEQKIDASAPLGEHKVSGSRQRARLLRQRFAARVVEPIKVDSSYHRNRARQR